jgi:hypothetical protein
MKVGTRKQDENIWMPMGTFAEVHIELSNGKKYDLHEFPEGRLQIMSQSPHFITTVGNVSVPGKPVETPHPH